MTTKVYQIFVSSTYADLADERRRVSETLAKAGYIPVGMELFPAADQKQLDFIKRVIDRSDYYVVIVGGRYGSLADDNVSFTEKEYEYAVQKQIPVLAFLHENPDKIEAGKTDKSEEQVARLKTFRDRLAKGRIVDFWLNPHELCTKVVIAVQQAINLAPGVGWVRGDEAVDPKVLQEAERLRSENIDLKKKLAEQCEDITFPEHLAGPADTVEVTVSAISGSGATGQVFPDQVAQVALGEMFIELFDTILTAPSEYDLRTAVGGIAARRLSPLVSFPQNTRFYVTEEDVHKLRSQYEALGLIEAKGAVSTTDFFGRTYDRKYIVWTVTEKARRFVVRARAIPRQSISAEQLRRSGA